MDETTRPWFTIDELSEWIDKYQNQEWRNAAIMLGEKLASVGPDGYYNMEAKDWLDWTIKNVQTQQRTWVGLTTDELVDLVIKHAGLPTKLAEAIEAKLREKNT
jgi:hypothetical protein